jgi:cytochrome b561
MFHATRVSAAYFELPIMPISRSPLARYTSTAIFLHWLLGFSLIGVFALGLYMAGLPFSPQRLKLFSWHKWAGILIFLLSIVRLGWRLTHRPPALPEIVAKVMPRWQHIAHHVTHWALYALFFIVPLVGWAYSSASGFQVVLFGVLPMPDFVAHDKVLAALTKPWHEITAYAMALLVLLHVGAAVKHQRVDHDHLIDRMLPSHQPIK